MACQQLHNDEHIGYCDILVYGKFALLNMILSQYVVFSMQCCA